MNKYSRELTKQGYYKKRYKENKKELQRKSKQSYIKKRKEEIEKTCKTWDNDLRRYLLRKIK